MSSFNEFEGIPASMNNYLMNELLRDTWGFKGFIVSDYTAVSEQIAMASATCRRFPPGRSRPDWTWT
jgi:Beta-glucosidase-related glycosidases